MGKQMILAVLIISVTLGTETKFQCLIIIIRPAADRTFMLRNPGIFPDLMFEFRPSLYLPRRHMHMASGGKEEYHEIQQ